MIAAAQRLQRNERIYLVGKASCPSQNFKSILRIALNTLKKQQHLGDLGSLLDFVSFGHISQSF